MSAAQSPANYDEYVRKLRLPRLVSFLLCTALFVAVFLVAVRIRLFAVITYGRIIHEFDPWFNYRATEYMVAHGYAKFEAWYDEKVWYPLGRHVGSTTYPGLQLTAYALHELLKHVHPMSVNDVCVLMPAAFGGVASLLCGALAYEVRPLTSQHLYVSVTPHHAATTPHHAAPRHATPHPLPALRRVGCAPCGRRSRSAAPPPSRLRLSWPCCPRT